jgi:hypothetical protein
METFRTAGVTAKIRTEDLQDTSLGYYRYASTLSGTVYGITVSRLCLTKLNMKIDFYPEDGSSRFFLNVGTIYQATRRF